MVLVLPADSTAAGIQVTARLSVLSQGTRAAATLTEVAPLAAGMSPASYGLKRYPIVTPLRSTSRTGWHAPETAL